MKLFSMATALLTTITPFLLILGICFMYTKGDETLIKYEVACREDFNLTSKFLISTQHNRAAAPYQVDKCEPSDKNRFCHASNAIWTAEPCKQHRVKSRLYRVTCMLTPPDVRDDDDVWFVKTFALRINLKVKGRMEEKKEIIITPLLTCDKPEN